MTQDNAKAIEAAYDRFIELTSEGQFITPEVIGKTVVAFLRSSLPSEGMIEAGRNAAWVNSREPSPLTHAYTAMLSHQIREIENEPPSRD